MSPFVFRRKLMKKSKRRRWARCGSCGGNATTRVRRDIDGHPAVYKRCHDCGRYDCMPWTGKPG
jgi:translation initiation factor 2 beta subunit (eIF-2beta)/eIF-5